jgi:biotin transport system substrate-specific component
MAELFAKTPAIEASNSHQSTMTLLRSAGLAVSASLFVAICAHISLPLLFSPVPLTMQPFAVLLVALLLEPATAFAALALYLAEGAAGLPVFTPLGIGGVAQMLGPTGGYLASYPFVAAAVSWFARKGNPTFVTRLASAAVGNVLILLCGSLWLAIYTHASARIVINMAILPFLPGDILKVISAAALATAWFRFRRYQPKTEAN